MDKTVKAAIALLAMSISTGACRTAVDPAGNAISLPSSTPVTHASQSPFVAERSQAVDIALNAWIPVYGEEHTKNEEPFRAEIKNGVWTVTGTLPESRDGGVVFAKIAQKDGKIIEIGHGK